MEKFIYKVKSGETFYFSTDKTVNDDGKKKHTIYDGIFSFTFTDVKYNESDKTYYAASVKVKAH